jgi:hypothetical protein
LVNGCMLHVRALELAQTLPFAPNLTEKQKATTHALNCKLMDEVDDG